MTLEDFFTLTEMKDGLTSLARVKELITVMQNEKDSIVKNVGDATRQWSAVGSTIAATDNKDCLDLFIQLGGLWFFDRWLKDAQEFSNDANNNVVEESISVLLRALETLHVNSVKSVSHGVWITVKNLVDHNNSKIKERARFLFDCWNQHRDRDAALGSDNGFDAGTHLTGAGLHTAPKDASPAKQSDDNEEKCIDTTTVEKMISPCVNADRPVEEAQIQGSGKYLDRTTPEDGPLDSVDASDVSNPVSENLPIEENSHRFNSEEVKFMKTFSSSSDPPELNEYGDTAKVFQTNKISPETFNVTEASSFSSPLRDKAVSSTADVANALELAMESNFQQCVDDKEKAVCTMASSCSDVRVPESEEKSTVDTSGTLKNCSTTFAASATDQVSDCSADVVQKSSGSEHKVDRSGGSESSCSRIESVGAIHEADEDDDDLAYDSISLKPEMNTKIHDVVEKRSDLDFDYGLLDPLEVARQVAIEVEREVVHYREPSCSSSERVSMGEIGQPDSPDSTNGNQKDSIVDPSMELPTGPDVPTKDSPLDSKTLIGEKVLATEAEKCLQDMEPSQVTEALQEPEMEVRKDFCDFDLNQVCSEDMDRSTPISVVSASRAAPAAGLPVTPLRFEGALGWKGSAATSAFRSASPRRVSEGDKTLSIGGNSNSSKQRPLLLEIDLNVAEGGEEKVMEPVPPKQFPTTSSLPSGESSLDASSRRSERLMLDLNRISEEGDAQSDWKMQGLFFPNRNGHQSPSRSSSSSSMQPLAKNFDLNDQPSFVSDSLDNYFLGKSPQTLNASGGFKSGDSAISIMGARVEVNRKDFVPQTLPLPNGRIPEPGFDVNLGRTGSVLGMGSAVPYGHASIYGFNGLPSAPNMPFSSALYGPGGPIPYLVDSRGTPVVPQIVGSAPAPLTVFSQPPFLMNMTRAPAGSDMAGPSVNNLDLNSRWMIEGGNMAAGGFRSLLNPGQGMPSDEYLRPTSQPSSSASGVGGKRKEPDGGWELSLFSYKQNQPPWK